MDNSHIDALEVTAAVLLRAFVISFSLLLFSFLVYLAADDWVYQIHSSLFDIGKDSYSALMIGLYGVMKILIIVLFLCPWLAIRHYLKGAH